jgi:hypothetical protein
MSRLRTVWDQMGGRLGLLLSLAGFVAIFLGWNGAASYDRVPAQMPYVISGGLLGIGLIVLGAAMVVVETNRRQRGELQASIDELRLAIEALGAMGNGHRPAAGADAGLVVAGASSYHRPSCRLAEGRDQARLLTPQEAEEEGLSACRICTPDADATRRQLKAR